MKQKEKDEKKHQATDPYPEIQNRSNQPHSASSKIKRPDFSAPLRTFCVAPAVEVDVDEEATLPLLPFAKLAIGLAVAALNTKPPLTGAITEL